MQDSGSLKCAADINFNVSVNKSTLKPLSIILCAVLIFFLKTALPGVVCISATTSGPSKNQMNARN